MSEKCTVCGKALDPSELYSGRGVCDLCVIKAGRDDEQKKTIARNLDRIPPEYRNQGILSGIMKKIGSDKVWRQNLFIGGTPHNVVRLKWAIMENVWENGKSVMYVNFISWYNEYKSGQSNKWDMMTGIVDYNGYVIIDCDNLYGIDDQSIIYSILQIRRERERHTCVMLTAASVTDEKNTISPIIKAFISDELINKYCLISVYK